MATEHRPTGSAQASQELTSNQSNAIESLRASTQSLKDFCYLESLGFGLTAWVLKGSDSSLSAGTHALVEEIRSVMSSMRVDLETLFRTDEAWSTKGADPMTDQEVLDAVNGAIRYTEYVLKEPITFDLEQICLSDLYTIVSLAEKPSTAAATAPKEARADGGSD